ncbi:MAG: hypothetical protein GX038_01625 [Erysipelothrix sp.]|nr:hypothetical protein [Erysipelothrix sp.]
MSKNTKTEDSPKSYFGLRKYLQRFNYNYKVVTLTVLSIIMLAFVVYQQGFSYELMLNGNSVGYVKSKSQVNEVIANIDVEILEAYGESAFHKDEIEEVKVREHTKDVVSADALLAQVLPNLTVYKPANVLMVDGAAAVALETKEEAEAILEEIKVEVLEKMESVVALDALTFNQEIEIVEEDVNIHMIYSKDIAKLVLDTSDEAVAVAALTEHETQRMAAMPLEFKDDVKIASDYNAEDLAKVPLEVVASVQVTSTEKIDYSKVKTDDASAYVGVSKVTQTGKAGIKELTKEHKYVNGIISETKVLSEKVLEKPVDQITMVGTKSRPAPIYNGNKGQSIVTEARKYLGIKYKAGGTTPSTGFDCSGFTKYVYAQFGISIPGSVSGQWNSGSARVTRSQLQPGDIVVYTGHTGIYIGGGKMIHAPFAGRNVEIGSINHVKGFLGGIRP